MRPCQTSTACFPDVRYWKESGLSTYGRSDRVSGRTFNPFNLNSLVSSSFTLATAYSINNKGMIFGDAIGPNGARFAYLATPVPEPSTWAMMIAGFTLAGVGARRRSRATAVPAFRWIVGGQSKTFSPHG